MATVHRPDGDCYAAPAKRVYMHGAAVGPATKAQTAHLKSK